MKPRASAHIIYGIYLPVCLPDLVLVATLVGRGIIEDGGRG